MANDLYDKAREKFGTAQINWLTDDFRCVLLRQGYLVNIRDDEFLSDIPTNARISSSQLLGSKSIARGYLLAGPSMFQLVSDTSEAVAVVLYREGVDDASSDLIAYIDDAGGLPFVPQGFDYYVWWDVGVEGLLRL